MTLQESLAEPYRDHGPRVTVIQDDPARSVAKTRTETMQSEL